MSHDLRADLDELARQSGRGPVFLRVWKGIIDAFGRGSGPIAPDPGGTGPTSARAASRTAYGGPTPPRRPLLTLAEIRSRQTYR